MKKLTILVLLCTLGAMMNAQDFLTIYNQNQALYKTEIELELKRGVHFYAFENIPTGIVTESVIFLPKDRNVALFSQSFEYDLANSQKTIEKYINKTVRLTTENETFSGTLIFYDRQNFGLLNESTKEMNIVSAAKVNNILLSEMPADFYTKPTLRWQLSSPRDAKFKADLSYLTAGINWRATYNVVLGKNDFALNSWVTINNRSGKDFQNVTLKLIAGNVQTHSAITTRGRNDMVAETSMAMMAAPPTFAEREFSDFRIYTLDKPADIDNNQEKQLTLYPTKTVKFNRKYEYPVGGQNVDVLIEFKNSSAAGLGLPLPAGNVNFYEVDEKDKTNQFVGVSRINNTSINQDVSLKIGTAFDIVAETKTLESTVSGRTRSTKYEVSITNNKSEAVEIEIIRNISSANVEILNPSITVTKKDAFTYIFKMRLASGRSDNLTFTERINN